MAVNIFKYRCIKEEQMDDLQAGGSLVDQTLDELDIINKWLGGNKVTIAGLKHLIGNCNRSVYHIADLGCGSGMMLRLMRYWGHKNDIQLKLTGVDANDYITRFARNKAAENPEIDFLTANILDESFKRQKFDIITSTLFTHHFSHEQLVEMIGNWRRQTTCGIVINDLHRHWLAYHSIKAITAAFSKSEMVRHDAPVSVLRAFAEEDWRKIMNDCGIADYRLSWHWAFRWLLLIPASG